MMAYRYLIHAVIERSPYYLIFCRPCSSLIVRLYRTSNTNVFAILSDYLKNFEKKFQKSHDLIRDTMNIKQ